MPSPDHPVAEDFASLARMAAHDPAMTLQSIKRSDQRDLALPCWPVWLAWSAQRGRQGILVADAREACPTGLLPELAAREHPQRLARGLALAALALGRQRLHLIVSPGREGLAGIVRQALDALAASLADPGAAPGIVLETHVEPPSPDVPPMALNPDAFSLSLAAWTRLPLALAGQAAGIPLEHGGRLVELPEGADLRQALGLEGLAVLDEGLSGFAAPDTPLILDPEDLAARGLAPAPHGARALAKGECPVDLTRQALYQHWRRSAVREGHPHRVLLARCARLAALLSLGRGGREELEELTQCAKLLDDAGLKAAHTLGSALAAFPEQWQAHAAGRCETGACQARRVAPCQERCPAGIDIPSFLSLTGRGEHAKAAAVMVQDNPLPYSCGLICPAPCEKVCLRGKVDKPIHIRAMKAVSARALFAQDKDYPVTTAPAPSGRRVAVVGGGPAGLACASFLARAGHAVTILEAMPKLGGMMRYGIPEYRLPKAILDREIATVTGLGVEVATGKALGRDFTLAELEAQGFHAVFLALGAWSSRALGLDGERLLTGVVSGTEFLVELGLGRKPAIGRKVVVVGGGNTAMDCARTAVRLGAEEVRVVYRRSRTEMPAAVEEVEEAEHEGVHFTFLAAPTRLVGEGGRLAGMEVVTMALGEPDASGRRRPEPKPGSERVIACDMIISAIGQFCDESFTRGSDGTLGDVCLTKWKTIQIDPVSLATDRPGVYAGGDAAQGPATVVEAIRDGKRAALAIDAHLEGRAFDPSLALPKPRLEREIVCSPRGCGWAEHDRPEIPMIPVSARQGNFELVELGLDQEMAVTESRRCLRCDVCIGCGLCQLVCSEAGGDALRFKEVGGRLVFEDFDRPTDKCVGCGACTRICPTGAMSLVLGKGETAIAFTGHSISEHATPSCPECGAPLPAGEYLEHLRQRLGGQADSARLTLELCPECAHKKRGASFVASLLR
ncbi:NADPH-Fe(3+) oxidoreductase subunit beta [Fundidesulfovibrio magnetotacticus]|uniref:NADPH-Fe(3+) oxidoreductase subunit beta n=1 Tax=Fundidesulfovibrio magnetotacticus TaxID=2730080 RepID=A0A6V8LMM8_9BACT|nr:FAD-dependent oxidoreductase [Fundidesulfovibrio magnetotacticus]GFK92954.1 NADPH-Fe(3+) oxidoreductase subunit beta [Fundidesulfovibrio magnetotacticus]